SEAIPFAVPGDLSPGPRLVALPTSRGPTLAVPVVATTLPVVTEADDAPSEPDKGQPVTLPAAVSGRLSAANDTDAYGFEAKKGQVYAFEVTARRAGAATDPVLKVVDAKGTVLAEADDTPGLGKDPRLEWTAPAVGRYALIVGDLHSRGGDEFGYVLSAEPAAPEFSLTCDPDKLNVGPGGRVPLFVQVTRRGGFNGAVDVSLGPLPSGVTASPLTVGPTLTQGVIVVSADPNARVGASLLTVRGEAELPSGAIAREVNPKQEIYLPGGGRGTYPVDTLALGVTEPSDVTVEATPAAITIAPGGTATIDVTVTRKAGFEQGVNLALVLQHLGGVHANPLPPGVTFREAGSKTLLGPKETRGKLVLQAAPDAAPVADVPVCVMAHVSINFVVKTAYASAPIAIKVTTK
ncbi:MAG: pre-peptidase, partial [Planctomycetia bacterium]|nr:pre-peptidase [Planctomycetia bacterium]